MHTGTIWVFGTTGAMQHELCDKLKQDGVGLLVWNFSANYFIESIGVHVIAGLRSEPKYNVGMWKAPLLKFNGMCSGNGLSKYMVFHHISD